MRSAASRVGALDAHLGLDNRHQAVAQHLPRNLELLPDHRGNALAVGDIDHRPFLGPEHAEPFCSGQQGVQIGHRFHHLDAVGLCLEALVDLDERNDPLIDKRLRGRLAFDLTVHRPLEQDRADNFPSAEAGRGDDPRAHLVDQAEHLLVARPGILLDAIFLERLGRGPARLVERGDKAVPRAIFAAISD